MNISTWKKTSKIYDRILNIFGRLWIIKKKKILATKNIWLTMENNLEEARVYSAKGSGNFVSKKSDLIIMEELYNGKRI